MTSVAGRLHTSIESLRIPVGQLDGKAKRPPVTQRDRGAGGHVILARQSEPADYCGQIRQVL